jgi:riboflavin synthase
MFSGIIQATEKVKSATTSRGIRRVRIGKPGRWKLSLGQSIAVDGVCSTVVKSGATFFDVEYMSETLAKTTASTFVKGRPVNLERSLKLGDLVDGHFVQGHVDGCATVASIESDGDSRRITCTLPHEFMRFIPPRGSITLNGVSLTVARSGEREFTVALIPHTLSHTNLRLLRVGDVVNVETDLVARYRVAGSGKK